MDQFLKDLKPVLAALGKAKLAVAVFIALGLSLIVWKNFDFIDSISFNFNLRENSDGNAQKKESSSS